MAQKNTVTVARTDRVVSHGGENYTFPGGEAGPWTDVPIDIAQIVARDNDFTIVQEKKRAKK